MNKSPFKGAGIAHEEVGYFWKRQGMCFVSMNGSSEHVCVTERLLVAISFLSFL